jgi:ankyrin repeat protein
VNKLNINQLSSKHGYPLHIAILSSKFDVAIEMLRVPGLDPHVLNTIQANCVHLLFLKYDKEPGPAFEVLKMLVKMKVQVNLIDSIGASPIHIALRKRQYKALQDVVTLNIESKTGQIFDLNMRDKRGHTPLHYAVEKQDYELFRIITTDKYINVHLHDEHEFLRPRRLTVIFSAFHKILYHREKMIMRKRFYQEVNDFYVDFSQINRLDP